MKKTVLFVFLFAVCSGYAQNGSTPAAYTSKYDFVSGEKVIVEENFENAELGNFPEHWSTNATAEIVSLNGQQGKWLKIQKQGVFFPELMNNLPENFTLEFDLAINNGWNGWPFVINLTSLKTPKDYTNYYHYVGWNGTPTVHIELNPLLTNQKAGSSKMQVGRDGNHEVNSDVEFKVWDNAANNTAHISLWRQNKRLRMYLNGEKIWDIQSAFDPATKYNAITFASQGSYSENDFFAISNLRLAIGAPDTRNKLKTAGKFVTTGIHFNSGSDVIKPDSYGVLKEVGTILKEAPMKIKIIGHTDADGDEKSNLDLSAKRANAVKTYLVTNFGLDAATLETEGKGEGMPIDKNTTTEGKANNRRVEFIKL